MWKCLKVLWEVNFIPFDKPIGKPIFGQSNMNLYAPNFASERAGLCLTLSDYVSLADCLLVGGDFNMIEDVADRMGDITTTISRWELSVETSFVLSMVYLIYEKCIHFHVYKDPFSFLDQMGVWLLQTCLG